jgi:hypothetical protein
VDCEPEISRGAIVSRKRMVQAHNPVHLPAGKKVRLAAQELSPVCHPFSGKSLSGYNPTICEGDARSDQTSASKQTYNPKSLDLDLSRTSSPALHRPHFDTWIANQTIAVAHDRAIA